MMLKTPAFWYRHNGALSLLEKALTPFSYLYRIGYEIHQHSTTPEKLDIPILCIGNLNAGGTGKTPVALAFMDTIRKNGFAQNPFFLLRGYGGGERGPLLVNAEKHNSWITGDEALILAAQAPTIIAVDRVQGALLAARKQADLVLMDDGLQNPGIHKDIRVVVINGEMGFGNRKMLPAGPLREPLLEGLQRTDIFILIGEDRHNILPMIPAGKPVIHARLVADESTLLFRDKPYLVFAGLGYPEKFFSFAEREMGLTVAKAIPYPDHYPYSEDDLKKLQREAEKLGAELLTTRKDYLRLPKIEGINVHIAESRVKWENEPELVSFLREKLQGKI